MPRIYIFLVLAQDFTKNRDNASKYPSLPPWPVLMPEASAPIECPQGLAAHDGEVDGHARCWAWSSGRTLLAVTSGSLFLLTRSRLELTHEHLHDSIWP